MKLSSVNLELAALRSVTGDSDRVVGFLLPRLQPDSFDQDHVKIGFMRAQTLLRKRGEMPHWSDLLEDLTLPQDVREELAYREVDPVRTRDEAERLVAGLEHYRRARTIYRTAARAAEVLKGESVDLDALTDMMSDMLTGARASVDMRDHTTTIGEQRADVRILREALTGTEQEFIPTGIRAFDAVNQGVPRGASFVIAGTTGGGKSALLMQIAMHMAALGARVVIISLEMTRALLVRRMLAHLTHIPLGRINAAHKLDDATRRVLIRAWHQYHERVRKNGGRLRLVAPPEDVSMDELLAMYRPYGFDMMGVDYLGLTKGMDSEDQWRKMGAAVRACTRAASIDNNIIALLCQLSSDGIVRYSRTIMEHAHLAWTWTYHDDAVRESRIITINQPKTRNLRSFPFYLRENFGVMRFDDLDPTEERSVKESRAQRKGGKSRTGHNGGPPLDRENEAPRRAFAQADFRL